MNYQLVKNIGRATIFGDKATLLKLVMSDEKDTHFVYRVFGSCNGVVRGPSRFTRKNTTTGEEESQDWRKLVGEFFAQTREGHGYTASQCFLPRDVEDSIIAQFDQGVLSVEFAYDIYARFDPNSATSYVFLARQVNWNAEQGESPAQKMLANMPPIPGASNIKQIASAPSVQAKS